MGTFFLESVEHVGGSKVSAEEWDLRSAHGAVVSGTVEALVM
jgi:hypothetical protein